MARGSKIMMLSGRNDNFDNYYLQGHIRRLARELLQQWHSILFNNIMNFTKYTMIYIERNIESLKSTDCCHEFALRFWKYPL